jgi:hypothetical protein
MAPPLADPATSSQPILLTRKYDPFVAQSIAKPGLRRPQQIMTIKKALCLIAF